jgi:uncharacterized protein YndB with AHSA1/START domain
MTAQTGDLTLKMTRSLPALPSVVFAAFSDPGELAKWWGPEGSSWGGGGGEAGR